MRYRVMVLAAVGLMILTSCSKQQSRIRSYDEAEVTRVVIFKGKRKMHLMNGDVALKSYTVGLGSAPIGHKQIEGDGRTPEGRYFIDRRNPESRYHLSLGISYPNKQDRARADLLGKNPGGDIFIHGEPRKGRPRRLDWTAGCISMRNEEIEQVYSMVRNGTPVEIYP
ncbi:MAG: hypothetical protein CSA73_00620 [Rhodobacterales bacterium]|nr:MAG: hypothetical protein CSA73_00620 [Rhodobacterales bacterium]